MKSFSGFARLLVSTAVGALGAAPLAAQPDSIEGFAESLDHVRERSVIETMLAASAQSDSPLAQLERGQPYARLFALAGDDDHLAKALVVFDSARHARPDDPWAHWGYAFALARGPNVRSNGDVLTVTGRSWSAMLGLDERARARGAVNRALELDATFDRAAALLAELALQTRSADDLQRAHDVLLAQMASGRPSEPALLMLSRTADALGDRETAVRAADALADRADPSPEALHALMSALLRTPGREEAGERTWARLLDRLTPALADRLFAELRPITTDAEEQRWRSADLEGRREWLRRFWDVRAGLSAVDVSERMAAHYRRLTVALDRYVRDSDGPPPPETLTGAPPRGPLDERGVIYLRHGEPYRRISTRTQPQSSTCARSIALIHDTVGASISHASPREATEENESWVYPDEDGGFRMYNFIKCRGFPDWVAPHDVPCDRSRYREWIMDRAAWDVDTQHCGNDTRERIRREARQAFNSDSYRPPFEAVLQFGYDLFAFRGTEGMTDLSAPLAIQAESLRPDTVSDGIPGHALDISLHVVDTVGKRAFRGDTLIVFQMQGQATGIIVTHVDLSVPPLPDAVQRLMVREATRSPGRGRTHGQHIMVPDFSGDSLLISTIVMGSLEGAPNWRRGKSRLR